MGALSRRSWTAALFIGVGALLIVYSLVSRQPTPSKTTVAAVASTRTPEPIIPTRTPTPLAGAETALLASTAAVAPTQAVTATVTATATAAATAAPQSLVVFATHPAPMPIPHNTAQQHKARQPNPTQHNPCPTPTYWTLLLRFLESR